jgi:uncharacterized protein (TIGR04255 family)
LWDVFAACVRPRSIGRVAVRYVNRLDLPGATANLEDFLRTYPEVAVAESLSGYFMQLQLPQDDIGAMLYLTEFAAPPVAPNKISVVLDIDLFRQAEVDPEKLWDLLETFHVRKNRVFEDCITDKVREMIR